MTLTVDTAIAIEAVLILSVIAIILAGHLLWKSGGEFMPETMKVIYRMVMAWFIKIGWGKDTGARRYPDTGESGKTYDLEYPNRREDS